MMSKESFPDPDDVHRQALLSSIDEAALATRRNQRRFWFLSVTWAVVIMLIAVMFLRQVRTLQALVDTTLDQLETQREELQVQQAELSGIRVTLVELKGTLFSLAALNFEDLPEEGRNDLATQLAEQDTKRSGTGSGGRLSEPEKTFLEQFSQNDGTEQSASAADSHRRGLAALSRGDNDEAIESFREALDDFDAPYLPAYIDLGRAYVEASRLDEAIEAFDASLLEEDSVSARSWRCFAQNHAGVEGVRGDAERHFREALVDCNVAVEQNPDDWWAYNTRGFTHLLLGDYDEAILNWRAAAARSSDPAYALDNIGLAYLSDNQWQSALDYTSEFNSDHGTNSSWNWFARAVATDKLGLDEAGQALERWEELRSEDDGETLKSYLPEELHSYIDSPQDQR